MPKCQTRPGSPWPLSAAAWRTSGGGTCGSPRRSGEGVFLGRRGKKKENIIEHTRFFSFAFALPLAATHASTALFLSARAQVFVTIGGIGFSFEMSPSNACVASYLTDTPEHILIGAIFLILFVAGTGVVYDIVSRRYLGRVVREHIAGSEARVKAEAARVKAEAASAEAKARYVPRRWHLRSRCTPCCQTGSRCPDGPCCSSAAV